MPKSENTLPGVTVWVDKYVPGWQGEVNVPGWHKTLPLVDALLDHHNTDAHFVPYWAEALRDGKWEPQKRAPRVTLAAVPALAQSGGRLRFGYGVVDVDFHDEPLTDAQRDDLHVKVEGLLPGCAWYDTRGGLRVIWRWGSPLSPEQYIEKLRIVQAYLTQNGLPVDPLRDWGRCYRLPFVLRDGEDQRRASHICEPAVFEPVDPTGGVDVGVARSTWDQIETLSDSFTMPESIAKGQRHSTLMKYAASLRAKNVEPDEVESALREAAEAYYSEHGMSSGAEKDLENIVAWAAGLPAGPSVKPTAGRGGRASRFDVPPDAYEEVFERGDSVEIAEWVLRQLERAAGVPAVYAQGKIWVYVPPKGRYCAHETDDLVTLIMSTAGMMVRGRRDKKGNSAFSPLKLTHATVTDIVKVVHAKRKQSRFFNKCEGVAFGDTFVRVTDRGIEKHPHSPSWRCNIGWDENWTDDPPVQWQKFLGEVFADYSPSERDVMIETLAEWVGTVLVGVVSRFQTALFFTGSGSNGKSQTSYVIEGLLPEERVTRFAPQHLSSEYNRAKLAQSMLNSTTEVPASEISDVAAALTKALISGDGMTGRYIYESPFDFTPVCGVVLAANALPPVRDFSKGFWRRMRLFGFTREFDGAVVVRDLGAKLLGAERVKIVCWALRATPHLLRRGEFRETTSQKALKDSWRNANDEISLWLSEAMDPASPGTGTTCPALYGMFRTWAVDNGIVAVSSQKFFTRLKEKVKPHFAGPSTARRQEYPLLPRKT